MIKNISEIIFTQQTAFSHADYFQIEVEDDKNILKVIDNKFYHTSDNPFVKILNDESIIVFLDNIFRIIDLWNEKYIDTNTIDGTKWNLLIKFKNGHSREYSGYGAYPDNFFEFEILKYNIIESIKGK